MRLVENKTKLRFLRSKLKDTLFFLSRKKKVMAKEELLKLLGKSYLLKQYYRKTKKQITFKQKLAGKKKFIFGQQTLLSCKSVTYNLILFIKNKSEYLSVKEDAAFCELNLDFWFLKKKSLLELLRFNVEKKRLGSIFNGSVVFLKCNNLFDLLKSFVLLDQKSNICGGFFVHNVFLWPEEFFSQILCVEGRNNFFMKKLPGILYSFVYKFFSFIRNFVSVTKLILKHTFVPQTQR